MTEGGPLFHKTSIEKEAFANHTIAPNVCPTIIQLLPSLILFNEVKKVMATLEQQALPYAQSKRLVQIDSRRK
jgi:hypothetical protein